MTRSEKTEHIKQIINKLKKAHPYLKLLTELGFQVSIDDSEVGGKRK